MSLILLLALSCPDTKMINNSGLPWNKYDYSVLQSAKKRCGEIYPDAPCVKKFYKKEETNYWVICGK
jgi:hypothetical protein